MEPQKSEAANHNAASTDFESSTAVSQDPPIQTKEESVEEVVSINIMRIFQKAKCSRLILSYLRLSHIVSLSFLSKSMHKTVNKYYGDCSELDLSEYYGVIGSQEFDQQSFVKRFLPKFKSVQSLSLRYCSHLKTGDLDKYLQALTPRSSNDNEQKGDEEDNVKNDRIKKLNLYFCSGLTSRALYKIYSRLTSLEHLILSRCYAITAEKDINGFKWLGTLPLQSLAISLDPSITKEEATDIISMFLEPDFLCSLKTLDLSHGCEVLRELEDLSDLTQIRKIDILWK